LLGKTTCLPPLERNRTYRVTVLLPAGRLQFFVDGVERSAAADLGTPLTQGRLALRTWRTFLAWSNLAVYSIL